MSVSYWNWKPRPTKTLEPFGFGVPAQVLRALLPLTLPLTFALTSLTFTLTLHPELLHRVRRQRDDLKLAAYQSFPLLRLFGFRPLFVPFIRLTLNFRLPPHEVQNPPSSPLGLRAFLLQNAVLLEQLSCLHRYCGPPTIYQGPAISTTAMGQLSQQELTADELLNSSCLIEPSINSSVQLLLITWRYPYLSSGILLNYLPLFLPNKRSTIPQQY